MMTKKVLYLIHLQKKHKNSYLDPSYCFPSISSFFRPSFADSCWTVMLMEWSWTTIMTVRSDGCTRRHMSVLCSSNVQLKLLLCVNKEDRKWQFGSSNQECHSQLHPLPAPDTSRGRRGHGSDSSFSPSPSRSLSPLFRLFYRTFHFNATYAMHNSQGEDRMMYGRHEPERRRHIFLNTPIKREACLVRLPWHPLSKSLPRRREAEKQMSWVCLPLLDRAVKICSWRTLKTAQMERMTCLRFSLFLCQEWVSWGETINSVLQMLVDFLL